MRRHRQRPQPLWRQRRRGVILLDEEGLLWGWTGEAFAGFPDTSRTPASVTVPAVIVYGGGHRLIEDVSVTDPLQQVSPEGGRTVWAVHAIGDDEMGFWALFDTEAEAQQRAQGANHDLFARLTLRRSQHD